MREVKTTRFGVLTVDENEIIVFPQGILGFEEEKEFFLIHGDEKSPFAFLQAVVNPDLTFVVIQPNAVCPSYEVDLPEQTVRELEIESPEKVLLLAIVTIPEDVRKTTVNLQGPLVVNTEKRIAQQMVIPGEKYGIRHPLFQPGKSARTA